MTHYTRAHWRARRANTGPGPLVRTHVDGIAIHWPATTNPIHGFNAVAAALRGWQNYHMDTKGWSDIAYQVAVDQDGNRYALRGLAAQSAANGDLDVNQRFGAVLLVLAPGEKPTAAMVAEVRNVVADFRKLFSRGKRIVGHGQIRPEPTACPGPITQGLILDGVFEPAKVIPPRVIRARRRRLRKAIAATRVVRVRAVARIRTLRARLAKLPKP